MKSRNKDATKRIRLTKIFFLVVCLATAISVIVRKSGYSVAGSQNLMMLLMIMALGLFGWLLAERCHSNLAQNIWLGFVLSIGSHWSLAFFHKWREALPLLIANSAIFAFVTFLGGSFAVLFHKVIKAKKRNEGNQK